VIPVLDDVSFELEEGQVAAVMGVSGAGKSTLLHVLGGLDRPDAGVIKLNGKEIQSLSRSKRTALRSTHIGYVFQSYHLLPELTVVENVLLPSMHSSSPALSRKDALKRAHELLEQVGLPDRHEHRPYELSGGEQQRVALARALMNDPDLILADEPTGNLDDETGKQILDCLMAAGRRPGHGMLMVTHSRDIALQCDRLLELKNGRLL
jgi:ABC-type lipoprotein export system ATPase subunit